MTTSRFLPTTTTTNTDGSGFLDPDDVTDSLARDFIDANDPRVQQWLDLVDGEIMSVAQEREVPLTSITLPVHKKILEYLTCYFCFLAFQDSYGRNDVTNGNMNNEGLKLKLEYYITRCEKLRPQLTKEMFLFTNISLLATQRAGGTFTIVRG